MGLGGPDGGKGVLMRRDGARVSPCKVTASDKGPNARCRLRTRSRVPDDDTPPGGEKVLDVALA